MSDSHALEAAKAHAKHLLRLARAGDVTVIRELRQSLPRLASENDVGFAGNVKLADVQHAMAVRRGLNSWAEFRRTIEHADPIQVQAERFLHAVRDSDGKSALELLNSHPDIAQYSIHAAAAACDAAAVASFLQNNAALANAPAPPNKAEPIIYACGTPLHNHSAAMAERNAHCVEFLLDAGANPDAHIMFDGSEGPAPISALYFAAAGGNANATRQLLARGANPNDGESIYHAAERNHRECLELLLAHGAEISTAHAEWGNTPLYFLAGYKPSNPLCASSELGMRWLLEHGANPNVPSLVNSKHAQSANRAEMPLHRVAAYGKSVAVAQMLVQHGATVDAPRGDGKTAYALAIRSGNTDVAKYLATLGANTLLLAPQDELLAACLAADDTRARAILAEHPDIIATLSADEARAIVMAAESDQENSVRLMVSLGWNLATEGEWGGTALHHAAWSGRPRLTQLLIALGAPVNMRDSTYGSSPIAWAAHGSTNGRLGHDADYCEVVTLLLDAGAEREPSYNKWNEAPESMSSKAVARLLKERGFSA